MNVMLLLMRSSERPEERQVEEAVHVERRAERGESAEEPDELADAGEVRSGPRGGEQFVFREEAGGERQSCDRVRRDRERAVRLRDLLLQAAHLADVLLAAHRMNHGAGT